MPSRDNSSRSFNAAELANAAKTNPYVQRLVNDAELRANIERAFGSGRSAYLRLSNDVSSARAALEDKKLQADVLDSLEALRDATLALTEKPKKRARKLGRKLAILALAFGLALAGSEKLRSKVLDALFGKEEQFEYTPPATPSTTPPTSPVSAA
jgi:hypothetical protein